MSIKIVFIAICCSFFCALPAFADLSGGSYEIYGDTFSFIGTGSSSGGNFALFDSGGEFFATSTSGGDYTLRSGFRAVEKGILQVTMSTSSVDLGLLDVGSVSSADIVLDVHTDSATGYTLSLREDGDLLRGTDDIDDVVGLAVIAGTEGYGFTAAGADVLPVIAASDHAIDVIPTTVASQNGTVNGVQTIVTLKAAIDGTTRGGDYSQTLYFLLTVNP